MTNEHARMVFHRFSHSEELIRFVEDWIEEDGEFEEEAVERAARWAALFGWIPKDERPIIVFTP